MNARWVDLRPAAADHRGAQHPGYPLHVTREDPSGQPDGAVLRLLPGGLSMVRYRKHDPIAHTTMWREELVLRTDKRLGSTFLSTWPITRYLEWLTAEVVAAGWQLAPATTRYRDVPLREPVGIVHTIRIVSGGRTVHMYPIADA